MPWGVSSSQMLRSVLFVGDEIPKQEAPWAMAMGSHCGVPSHDFDLQQQPAQIVDFYKPVSQDLSKLKVRLGALGEQKHNVRPSFYFFFQAPKKVPMVSNASFDKDTFLHFDKHEQTV